MTLSQPLTYEEMHAQAMQLLQSGDFADALNLLDREGGCFPEQRANTDYLRLCLATRLDISQGLQMLATQLESGFWYGEEVLRQSPSLRPLQGLPEFERLLDRSKRQQLASQGGEQVMLTRPPQSTDPTTPSPLLLALHGNNGAAAESLAFWESATQAGWFVAVPQSTQAIWSGAYVWNDHDLAVQTISDHYTALREEKGLDFDQTVIAGFSMGAQLAAWLALSGTVPARGFVALGIHLPADELERWLPLITAVSERHLRGYLIAGTADDVIVMENLTRLQALLQEQGIPCELELVEGGSHHLLPEYLPAFRRGVSFVSQEARLL